jgi:hypothetical protein
MPTQIICRGNYVAIIIYPAVDSPQNIAAQSMRNGFHVFAIVTPALSQLLDQCSATAVTVVRTH